MKLRKIILAGVAAILLLQTNSYCRPNQAPPPGFATRLDYLKSLTNETVIAAAFQKGLISDDEQMVAIAIEVSNRHYTNMADVNRDYRSGIIGKGEAMMAMRMAEAMEAKKKGKPMDTYGKVVDQDSQPVVGAKVRGFLTFGRVDYEEHFTTTDAQGQFRILGLKGDGLGIVPKKEGYEFNREIWFAANAKRPDNYLPDLKNPLVFRMWKMRGGEPMSRAQIYSYVDWDSDFKHFDLYKSQQDPAWNHHPLGTNGELMVKATHGILFTNGGVKMFPWTFTLAITNGGLIAFNDPYPYVAPAEGYQTFVTFEGPTNFEENPTTLESWGNGLRRGFYFKSKNGQIYGRMVIRMSAGRNYASFDADIYVNATGSRDLEYNSTKQIFTGNQRKIWPLIWPNEP